MSPVEPSPVLIGRMGLPSIARADGLGFLPKNAALSSEGANMPPVSVPSAARNERRFQPNFSFMPIRPFPVAANNYLSAGGAGGVTTSALPTISISESPGIHSTAMQARDGALPGEKHTSELQSPDHLVCRLLLEK